MPVKLHFGLALLLILCGSLHAASVTVDDSCTGTPIVGSNFSFLLPAPVSGTSSTCLQASFQFQTLDLYFAAPPFATDINPCSSNLFSVCTISQNAGTTDVHFAAGSDPGVAAGMDFNVKLQGFTTGQQINGVANLPEPGAFRLVAFGIMAAALFKIAPKLKRCAARPRPAHQ
jgi:hypothetical protein